MKPLLVLGFRRQLCRVLVEKRIPFVLWTDSPGPNHGEIGRIVGPLSNDKIRLAAAVEDELKKHGGFGFVLAPSEKSVLPASLLRRLVGARKSSNTVVMRCRDKLQMKEYLSAKGVPMTPFVRANKDLDVDESIKQLGLPLVVKQRSECGGRGLIIAHSAQDIEPHLSNRVILEKFVDSAKEYSVESFVSEGNIEFTNLTEYYRKQFVNIVPGEVDEKVQEQILAINAKVIESLPISWGMTHLECFVRGQEVLFGEIALRPPGGHIMELIELAYGFSAWEAFVAVEMGQDFAFPNCAEQFAAGTILHPGPGLLKAITGQELVAQSKWTRKCKIRAKVGDNVSVRAGVGQEIGYVLQAAKNRQEAVRAIQFVDDNLQFELS